MKKFLIRLLAFALPLTLFAYALFRNEGGYSDPFYLRFTSSQQQNLILGTSRAAQGLRPSEIEKVIGGNSSFYNYAFTLADSPYGPAYLKSIRRKLKSGSGDSFFILSVDPWSISARGTVVNDSLFAENSKFMSGVSDVNRQPNLQYLLNFYPKPYYEILRGRLVPGNLRLHEDGWLEVSLRHDSITFKRRVARKIQEYQRNAATFVYSPVRLQYLEKTIEMLKQHGHVYLVRLPVHPSIFEFDQRIVPDFEGKMSLIADKYNIPFLDLQPEHSLYEYTDGNHLHKTSATAVSRKVAFWIKEQQTKVVDRK